MNHSGYEQAASEGAKIWAQIQEIKQAKKELLAKQKALKEALETVEDELLKPYMDHKGIERTPVGETVEFVRWKRVKQITPNAKTLAAVSKYPGINEVELNQWLLKKLGMEHKEGIRWRAVKSKSIKAV
jgi:hypothetical protein